MTSSFWLLGVESRDFSEAEKERTACKTAKNLVDMQNTIFSHFCCRYTVMCNELHFSWPQMFRIRKKVHFCFQDLTRPVKQISAIVGTLIPQKLATVTAQQLQDLTHAKFRDGQLWRFSGQQPHLVIYFIWNDVRYFKSSLLINFNVVLKVS